MRTEGEKEKFEVYCGDGKKHFREFLLDIVWFNPESARPDLLVESEWANPAAVAFDFEKLLSVKAGS